MTFADTQFKASGDLVEQMRAGAQVDALITASKGTMDDAVEADLVDESTREDMFVNDLVIVKAEGSDLAISSIEDVANLDGKIAVGDAATVPAGKYANQGAGLCGPLHQRRGRVWRVRVASIADKVALADKVGTAAKYVSTGDCAAGFVYSSDIYRYDGIEEAFVCPDDFFAQAHRVSRRRVRYQRECRGSGQVPGVLPYRYKDAQKIWAKYGFELSE